jgi:hypothetical protein
MLVIFKCKVAGDIIMYEDNAKPILDLIGRDLAQGIILPDEIPGMLAKLEAEIARRKEIEMQEKAERDARERIEAEKAERDGVFYQKPRQMPEPVSFAARTFPLIEMMKRAHTKNKNIVWGV